MIRKWVGRFLLAFGCALLVYGAVYDRNAPVVVGIACVTAGAFAAFYRVGR